MISLEVIVHMINQQFTPHHFTNTTLIKIIDVITSLNPMVISQSSSNFTQIRFDHTDLSWKHLLHSLRLLVFPWLLCLWLLASLYSYMVWLRCQPWFHVFNNFISIGEEISLVPGSSQYHLPADYFTCIFLTQISLLYFALLISNSEGQSWNSDISHSK